MKIDLSKLFVIELPQIAQYDDYKYSAECCCPECSRTYKYGEWIEHNTEGIVGYCVQQDGSYCICLECPKCFTKYRYHLSHDYIKTNENKIVFDIEKWKHDVALAMFLQNKRTGEYEKFKIKE